MATFVPDYELIARQIVSTCARVKRGENVVVAARKDNLDYAELIALECWKAGARPVLTVASDEHLARVLKEVPIEFLREPMPHLLAAVEKSDVVIITHVEYGNPAVLASAREAAVAARRLAGKPVVELLCDGKRRTIATDFPTPEQAAAYGLEFEEYQAAFWAAMGADYAELKRRCAVVASVLRDAPEVRIATAKGTDLVLDCSGRPVIADDGVIDEDDIRRGWAEANLPAGEVFVAPVEDGCEGIAVFDLAFRRGQRIADLRVRFEAGKAALVSAAEGFALATAVLACATGDKDVIGEFGVGVNPHVRRAVGFTLTDEKIAGTVHIALGKNDDFGGRNDSDLHWDLLILEPTVTVGGRILIDRGTLQVS